MLKISHTQVMNIDNAIRGARNPMNSWAKSDSYYDEHGHFILGEADLAFGRRLALAGSDHRKFLRQIFVSMDITAPFYWWKEFDTYKVGTVADSCSTMHKIHAKPFELEDFSHDRLSGKALECLKEIILCLERERLCYMETKDPAAWHNMIQLLPSSYMQMRTVTMNYEVLINIYYARREHKLAEWHTLCDHIKSLPYAEQWILVKEKGEGNKHASGSITK